MHMNQDEWKSFIKTIGQMIDARGSTLETNLKGYIEFVVKTSEASPRYGDKIRTTGNGETTRIENVNQTRYQRYGNQTGHSAIRG